MLIILEGVDRCGKSTLANVLQKELGWPLYHHSKPPARAFDYFMESMVKVRGKDNAIFDRFHWSQLAYGPVFRDQLGLTKLEREVLDQWCLDRNTLVMYLGDTAKNIRSRWSDDEMYSADNIELLQEKYDEIMRDTPLPYSRSTLSSWVDDNGKPAWRTLKLLQSIREGSSL